MHIKWIYIIILIFISKTLFSYDVKFINELNEYGGKTVEYQYYQNEDEKYDKDGIYKEMYMYDDKGVVVNVAAYIADGKEGEGGLYFKSDTYDRGELAVRKLYYRVNQSKNLGISKSILYYKRDYMYKSELILSDKTRLCVYYLECGRELKTEYYDERGNLQDTEYCYDALEAIWGMNSNELFHETKDIFIEKNEDRNRNIIYYKYRTERFGIIMFLYYIFDAKQMKLTDVELIPNSKISSREKAENIYNKLYNYLNGKYNAPVFESDTGTESKSVIWEYKRDIIILSMDIMAKEYIVKLAYKEKKRTEYE